MGMGMGAPPSFNPFNDQQDQTPNDRRPMRRRMRGKWSTDAVDQELPFIKEVKRIIENPGSTIGSDASGSFKSKLKVGLEQLGWKLNRRATFAELDADERYRIEMTLGNSSVIDYKIMKWVYVETSAGGFELNIISILTNRWFLILVALAVVGLLILMFINAFNLCGQPVE